jgi:uncharacterized protein (TIGR02679 family)
MSLAEHLRDPAFSRLFDRVRQRLEREPDALKHGKTQLRDPSSDERKVIEGLLGRRFTGRSVTVALSELDEALESGTGAGLVEWLTRLTGPLRDRPAEERARQAAIEAALHRVAQGALASEPWFTLWIEELQSGPMTRLVGEEALDRLHAAVRVLEALPAAEVPIALFASDNAGGTKALDGTPLERLCLRALALRADVPRPENAGERRALWERFGVYPDDLATHVLVLNIPATGDGVVDQMLRLAAVEGLPVRLTLHQLVRHPPTVTTATVFVCENPAVLRMAAERLGPACAPLVSTEGRANTAFWRLMDCLPGRVRARGDFDKEGLEIAGAVLARTGGEPWRYDVATYLSARRENKPVPRKLPSTPWEPSLAQAMAGNARVEEEELLDILLADLQAGTTGYSGDTLEAT